MLYNQETIFKYRDKAEERANLEIETLVEAGEQRRGLAVRETDIAQQDIEQAVTRARQASKPRENPTETWFNSIYESRKRMNQSFEEELGFAPLGESEGGTTKSNRGPSTVPDNTPLSKDEGFMEELTRVANKYGRPVGEFLQVIKGESGYNPKAVNRDSQATGLFQFIPSTAEMLGTSVADIRQMSPREQVQLYDRYLTRFGYDGKNSLGIMQAAPAYASKSDNAVIYRVGTKAWEQNPGWRSSPSGPITVRSINQYYERQT